MKIMRKNLRYSIAVLTVMVSLMVIPSCKDFLNPDQELNIRKDQLFDDWYEYRAVAMGLYGLQQKLVEQLVVLGELRGDLLTVTPNADADLIEINNFKVSKTNKYANPTNFYKLISACNSFITELKTKHPEVMDKKAGVTNYDKLYGEALCMRAWAYFNAVRIYGKVPVIHESLTSVEEIEQYLNTSSTYKDSAKVYARDGYNYTYRDTVINLPKQFYDVDMVIQTFSKQLETEVKAVGVNHYIDNNDKTWEVTIWNTFAWNALLGQMYLTSGDLIKAASHLNTIAYTTSDNYRYQLGPTLRWGLWRNIFTTIDNLEHIYVLKFDKATQQQNDLQRLFDNRAPHQYMLKPTKTAIDMWETVFRLFTLNVNQARPELTKLAPTMRGIPSDFFRGYGTSYIYSKNGVILEPGSARYTGTALTATPRESYLQMLAFKMENDVRSYTSLMDGMDTVVYKYSVNKTPYDQDANFIVYRAGGIQLYLAEIYTWWAFEQGGFVSPFTSNALNIVNDGSNYSPISTRVQLGVRGRVGLSGVGMTGFGPSATPETAIQLGNIIYKQHPYTNEVTGYIDLTNNLLGKQEYLEDRIMDERARELAFEGERFYDLMRVANRRNDPSYLANRVSAKYPSSQRDAMRNLLKDKKNWYIHIFD